MTKILLVEDDKSLREIYGVRLMAEGYEITSAGDGEEALAVAIKVRPDLIVSDVMMPKISGFDMLDILRSTTETKDIKVIMMTALSSEDQRARGEALGADRYLVKSQVGIEDVVRTVHDVLGDNIAPAVASEPVFPLAATPTAFVAAPVATPVAPPVAMPAPAPQPEAQPAPAFVAPVQQPVINTPPVEPLAPQPVAYVPPVAPIVSAPFEPNVAPVPVTPFVAQAPAPEPLQSFALPVPTPLPAPQLAPLPSPVFLATEPLVTTVAPVAMPEPAPVALPFPPAAILPEPIAPFSSPRPGSLGDRVINPLPTADSLTPGMVDIASQMNQELNAHLQQIQPQPIVQVQPPSPPLPPLPPQPGF